MNNIHDLKFEITLSTKGYDHKPNANDYKMMKWSNPMSITLDTFDVFISNGYSYCHIYKDNRRCINNFLYTYVVNIDIDDSDIPMKEYIDGLTQKPTYAYTTCSNGIKGYRFRLIYVFNEKLGTDNYKSVYQEICTKNNIILNDNCGYSIGQLMNGNGLGNIETYKSYNVYSLEDFGIVWKDDSKFRFVQNEIYSISQSPQYISNCTKRTEPTQEDIYNYIFRNVLNSNTTYNYVDDYLSVCANIKTKKLINHIRSKLYLSHYGSKDEIDNLIIDNITILSDYSSMSSTHFLQTYTYERNYTIYNETELEYNNLGYHKFSDDEEYYKLYVNFRRDGNGKTKVVKYVDGQHRRKRFLKECNLICNINRSLGFDELLFNAVYRRHYFYDNSDKVMTNIWLINTVIESYCSKDEKVEYSKHPKLTTSKQYCLENGLNRKGYSRTCQKLEKYNSIGEWYDCGLSVQENFRIARENGWYDGCLNTLRNFCKEYDITTNPQKQDISEWYDHEKSVKENLKYAKDNGIKVGRTKLYEYCRSLRDG